MRFTIVEVEMTPAGVCDISLVDKHMNIVTLQQTRIRAKNKPQHSMDMLIDEMTSGNKLRLTLNQLLPYVCWTTIQQDDEHVTLFT